MWKFIIPFSLFVLISSILLGQSTTISNVEKIDFKNIQVIKNGEEVIGYYAFYKSKTDDSKSTFYQLTLLDKDLNTIKTNKLTEDKSLFLIDMQYNLELICFKFYDSNAKRVVFKFFSKEGELMSTKNYSVDLYAGQLISLSITNDIRIDPSLYSITGIGFLNYRWVKHDKPGYEIRFYPNSLEDHSWTYRSNASSPVSEFATLLAANKDVIINQIALQKDGLYKETSFEISVLKTSTGKELFRTKLNSTDFEESVLNAYYDEVKKEVKLIGMYYKKGSNILASKSKGIVITTLNADGKVKLKQNYAWKDAIADLLPSDSLLNEEGSIFFHRILKQEDGSILALGESFTQVQKGISITTKVLPSSNLGSNAKYSYDLISGNFYIFKFNADFKLEAIDLIDKKPTKISLPAGAATYGMHFMAIYSNLLGGFSFNHFQYFDHSRYRLFYSSTSKENDGPHFYGRVNAEGGVLEKAEYISVVNNEVINLKVLPNNSLSLVLFSFNKNKKQVAVEIK